MEPEQTADSALAEPVVQERPACQHHWVIDSPAGPTSRGVCRRCGEERDFQNYVEATPWGGEFQLEQLSSSDFRRSAGIDVIALGGDSRFDEDA